VSLPFFHIERIERLVADLATLRYRDRIPLDDFIATSDDGTLVNSPPPNPGKESKVVKLGEFWSGRDRYLWLHKELRFPRSWEARDALGIFDFGRTGSGNNASFESLLYVQGSPYQGVDSNHQEVFFDLQELGCTFELDFRLWSGLEGGGVRQIQYHQFKEAYLAWLDGPCDDLYYLARNLIETVRLLDEGEYRRHGMEKILVKTFQIVDFTNPGSQEFYRSVAEADAWANEAIGRLGKQSDIRVHCVGQTHLDLAWLWRYKHTREKAARSFSTVTRLQERYGDYVFLQTQAQLYEYVKEDFPDLYERIKERVAQGLWEPAGAMWVEADCNLPSGESLVRQILKGKGFFEKEFGYPNSFLWLPDVFGYSWALPQILKKSGIDTFLTTKISWNEVNRLPYDTFLWRGIDGSEVLTHFITTPDVSGDTKYYTYNGNVLPKIVDGIWKSYRNKDLNQELLLAYGYGDGGGGPNRDMLENRRRAARIPGLPSVDTGTVTEYLRRLHATFAEEANTGYRHVWDNELYLEFHRGTYTSQAYNKMMNRRMELRLRDAEILSVAASLGDDARAPGTQASPGRGAYPRRALDEAWKIVLRNQFHDVIPGSSIAEVYEDSRAEYAQAEALVNRVLAEGTAALNEPRVGAWTIFNSAAWARSSYARIPISGIVPGAASFIDGEGRNLPFQEDGEEILVHVPHVDPTATAIVRAVSQRGSEPSAPVASSFRVTGSSVESPFHVLRWNEVGQLVELFDKSLGRNVLAGPGNVFEIFEDKPRQYDAWELESTIDLKMEKIEDFLGAELQGQGPCFTKIRFAWRYNRSSIEQDLVVYADLDRIDFRTRVDWQERDKLLKVAFPVDVRSTSARYDIQYGSVERPTHRSTSWDFAKFEVLGHQWADLAEKGLGVALMNDCKYGYDIKDNVMRLSLLKSASYPDPQADRGLQEFTYALYVHGQPWFESGLIERAWDLNAPLLTMAGVPKRTSPLLTMENRDVALDAVKGAEDGEGFILRFHEMHGGKTRLRVKLNLSVKGYREVNLMEDPVGPTIEGHIIEKELRPFEIYTVRVEPSLL